LLDLLNYQSVRYRQAIFPRPHYAFNNNTLYEILREKGIAK
jgi:hypothetical protein